MKRLWFLVVLMCLPLGCRNEPATTPDLVATQIAIEEAAHATMTARAPVPTTPLVTTVPPTVVPTLTSTDTPTLEPTVTSAPTNAPASAPTQTATHTSTPTRTPTRKPPTPSPTPIVYRPEPYTVVNVAPGDVLNVRAGPGVTNAVVGSLPPHAQNVQVGETGQEVAGSLWLPVWHRGTAGWVNSGFLAPHAGLIDGEIASRAAEIIWAIKNQDMEALAATVDTLQGVRFSPYTYVDVDEDLVFTAVEVSLLWEDSSVYPWGIYAGSGEPIDLTFQEFYSEFLYDVDFARPDKVGYDEFIGWGSMINNIREVYPSAVVVEYHFEGSEQYGYMDWRSLRLVLMEEGDVWHLVGVVSDEWTP